MINELDYSVILKYKNDWNLMAKKLFGVRLDRQQRKILEAIQKNKRISIRSGHSRGKDYVAAVASLCFLYTNYPSKVINTGPTQRQVTSIMMAEISKLFRNAIGPIGGELLTNRIKFEDDSDWYLEAFKAADKETEAWTGFHSPNIMVVVTEASGIEPQTFTAIEGLLTGNSKLILIFNPNRTSGEIYKSVKDPTYIKYKLNCLNAPNVRAKKILIPGQVDYEWVLDKVQKWCIEIEENTVIEEEYDFRFDGKWYRPNDLFLVKVMGEFPRESEEKLIPLSWIEAAIQRWHEYQGSYDRQAPLKLGADIAGMGRDMTVFCLRRDNYVEQFVALAKSDHMATVGKIKNYLVHAQDEAYIDTIGEGAGVYSRLHEQDVHARSVKFSESAKNLHDYSRQLNFVNMRAYLYWAIKDALDPRNGYDLCLPPNDMLIEDLNEPIWKPRSDGSYLVEEKEEIRKRLGRSPDYGDALALTFYPKGGMTDFDPSKSAKILWHKPEKLFERDSKWRWTR